MLPTTDCNEWPSNDCIIIVLHCLSSVHTPRPPGRCAPPGGRLVLLSGGVTRGPGTLQPSATLTPPPPGSIHTPGNISRSSETSDHSWSPIHDCPYSIKMPATSLTLHRRCVADIWPGCSAPTLDPGLAMDEIEQDLRGLRPAFVASQVHLAVVVHGV